MTAHPKTTFRNHYDWTATLSEDNRNFQRGMAIMNCHRIWAVAPGTKPYEAGPLSMSQHRRHYLQQRKG